MSRPVLFVLLAALVGIVAAAGFMYYDRKENTLMEIGVGSHSVSVQKN
jgi:hypothetical protein